MTSPVLLFSEHFPARVGGTSTYALAAVKALCLEGVQGELITYDYGSPTIELSTIQIHRLRAPSWLRLERYFPVFAFPLSLRLIMAQRPVLIHVIFGHFAAILGTFLGKMLDIPVAITIHNLARDESKIVGSRIRRTGYATLVRWFDRIVCRLPALIAVPSSHVAKKVKAIAPFARVIVIPHGLDAELFTGKPDVTQEKSGSLQILCVAGFIRHKGQDVLIRSLSKALNQGLDFECNLVGKVKDERFWSFCLKLIEENHLNDRIRLLPSTEASVLRELFLSADVYVQPSREEGFCLAVLEAMLFGKPVIGTQTGAMSLLLKPGHGIMIPVEAPDAIAEALLLLGSKPDLREDMGRNARDYARTTFSIERLGERFIEMYQAMKYRKSPQTTV